MKNYLIRVCNWKSDMVFYVRKVFPSAYMADRWATRKVKGQYVVTVQFGEEVEV